ncbi:MAG: DUF104 domain-containing protein [Planctomycetes bacterium]|nr:DUF104 domain-containing protein [Planctomycetota bacterium]
MKSDAALGKMRRRKEVVTMVQTIEAVYENGVLRPLSPLQGIEEHRRVKLTVEAEDRPRHPLADCVGILPDEDAEEMLRIIEEEFEKVDPREWQ